MQVPTIRFGVIERQFRAHDGGVTSIIRSEPYRKKQLCASALKKYRSRESPFPRPNRC